MILGYTSGAYDLFHIGHLNLLRNARSRCDRLIVAVTTDELIQYKHKTAVIPLEERMEILRSNRFVDEVVIQDDLDKMVAWRRYHFDVIFVGDDWKGTESWNKYEFDLAVVGARVEYLPYTKTTSSTFLRKVLLTLLEDNNVTCV